NVGIRQPHTGALQGLRIAQREAKDVDAREGTVGALVGVRAERAVAANDSAQVAGAIFLVFEHRCRKSTRAHQLVVDGQVRTTPAAMFGTGDEFPAALGEEAVIAANG